MILIDIVTKWNIGQITLNYFIIKEFKWDKVIRHHTQRKKK